MEIIPLNIRDFNNCNLAAHNSTKWMTKTFLDRITLTIQFVKGSIYANYHHIIDSSYFSIINFSGFGSPSYNHKTPTLSNPNPNSQLNYAGY
jgi:hypothetical protein